MKLIARFSNIEAVHVHQVPQSYRTIEIPLTEEQEVLLTERNIGMSGVREITEMVEVWLEE